MKSLTLVFYGVDVDAGKAAANSIRKDGGGAAQLRHAYAFDASEKEPADAVLALADVSEFDVSRLKAVYGDIVTVVAPSGILPPPPPPPPPGDPLANLPATWKDGADADLMKLAAAVSGGRAVDNKAQAIEVIDAALAARAK